MQTSVGCCSIRHDLQRLLTRGCQETFRQQARFGSSAVSILKTRPAGIHHSESDGYYKHRTIPVQKKQTVMLALQFHGQARMHKTSSMTGWKFFIRGLTSLRSP